MAPGARHLPDPEEGVRRAHHVVICDRDAKCTAAVRRILQAVGVRVIRTPRQAPTCTAHAARVVLSITSEWLTRMRFVGDASLRRAGGEDLQHSHRERPPRGAGTRRSIPRRGPRRGRVGALSDSAASSKHDARAAERGALSIGQRSSSDRGHLSPRPGHARRHHCSRRAGRRGPATGASRGPRAGRRGRRLGTRDSG